MPAKDWKNAPAKDRAEKIIQELKNHYEPECALHHKNAFELLIATILSAQCTDERVNKATPKLFEAFPNARALSGADQEAVEDLIRSTGFFRQKAKSLIGVSRAIHEQHGGEVPDDMDSLVKLPGVGRKTANVVLGTAYGQPAVMIDTHAKRLSNRLGFSQESNPDKIEQDLIALIPADERTDFAHRLIWHGRKICHARKPRCGECPIANYCPGEAQAN